jgi:SnoaL-like domain
MCLSLVGSLPGDRPISEDSSVTEEDSCGGLPAQARQADSSEHAARAGLDPDETLYQTPEGDRSPAGEADRGPAERLITGYIDAFNARDLDGVLERLHQDVVLEPTRIASRGRAYHGHQGAREWWAQVLAAPEYQARVVEFLRLSPEHWVVAGEVGCGGEATSPFVCTIGIRDGRIATLRSHLTDQPMLRLLGRLP